MKLDVKMKLGQSEVGERMTPEITPDLVEWLVADPEVSPRCPKVSQNIDKNLKGVRCLAFYCCCCWPQRGGAHP